MGFPRKFSKLSRLKQLINSCLALGILQSMALKVPFSITEGL